ncbi:hypothetical protein A2U01_0086315, partial [Trifolium medium]|nr:hypothetical protein [Trifolium medium]
MFFALECQGNNEEEPNLKVQILLGEASKNYEEGCLKSR